MPCSASTHQERLFISRAGPRRKAGTKENSACMRCMNTVDGFTGRVCGGGRYGTTGKPRSLRFLAREKPLQLSFFSRFLFFLPPLTERTHSLACRVLLAYGGPILLWARPTNVDMCPRKRILSRVERDFEVCACICACVSDPISRAEARKTGGVLPTVGVRQEGCDVPCFQARIFSSGSKQPVVLLPLLFVAPPVFLNLVHGSIRWTQHSKTHSRSEVRVFLSMGARRGTVY